MSEALPPDTLLTFPCDFQVKVMGKNEPPFETATLAIIHEFFPKFDKATIKSQLSKNGKFLSLTIKVHAESKAQMDHLYRALTSSKHSLFVL